VTEGGGLCAESPSSKSTESVVASQLHTSVCTEHAASMQAAARARSKLQASKQQCVHYASCKPCEWHTPRMGACMRVRAGPAVAAGDAAGELAPDGGALVGGRGGGCAGDSGGRPAGRDAGARAGAPWMPHQLCLYS